MRQTSSDDPRVFAGGDIHVPDSQTVVPDTQSDSEYLSPSDAAVLARTAPKKGNEFMAATLFSRDHFAKGDSLGESSCPPQTSVGFAFAQPNRGSNKSTSKSEKTMTQAENCLTNMEQVRTAGR